MVENIARPKSTIMTNARYDSFNFKKILIIKHKIYGFGNNVGGGNGQQAEEKEACWNKAIEEVNEAADAKGLEIDDGIKEAVAAFIVNGFPTSGSCEGHVKDRFGKKVKNTPYVEVGEDEPSERYTGETAIKESIAAKYGVAPEEIWRNETAYLEYMDYFPSHNIPETPEFLAYRAEGEERQRNIKSILEAFYQDKQISEDEKIIIEATGPGGKFRVTTTGENPYYVQEGEDEKCKKQLLIEQEKMKEFARFLKERFLS